MNGWKAWVPSRRWLIVPPIVIGVAVVALLALSRKELPRVAESAEVLPLTVRTVERQRVRPQVTGYGTAEADRRWNAIAQVGGRLVQTHPQLKSGTPVQVDELLLEIDPTDYELQLKQRQADLRQARSQLEQLKLDQKADEEALAIQRELLDVTRADLERLRSLRNRTAASVAEFDKARAALLRQEQSVQNLTASLSTYPARIEAAQATVANAAARVQVAQRDLDRARIVAPFDGLLENVNLEPGQYVAPGQSLLELLDTSSVEIETQISMSQWSKLVQSEPRMLEGNGVLSEASRGKARNLSPGEKKSAPARFSPNTPSGEAITAMKTPGFDLPPGFLAETTQSGGRGQSLLASIRAVVVVHSGPQSRTFSGTPVRFSSSIDPRTRTLGVIIRVDNPTLPSGHVDYGAAHIRAGSYCEVILQAENPIEAFRLPRSAVQDSTVLVVDDEQRLRRRDVVVALTLERESWVQGGLSPGDRVVTTPPATALEGQPVEPIEEQKSDQSSPDGRSQRDSDPWKAAGRER